MVNERPKVNSSSRYSINETISILGISRKTLYNHTREQHIKRGLRKCNNRPFYTGAEILRFWGGQY